MKRVLVLAVLGTVVAAGFGGTAARGDVTSDTFATDPIAGGRATVQGSGSRFTYSAASHTVTAAYNSTLATAKLLFPLTSAVTQNRSFTFNTTFTINSIVPFNDPNSFTTAVQFSFGLLNSATTGNDRVTENGTAFDMAAVDYFPFLDSFTTPSIGPSVVRSANADTNYYDALNFPFNTSKLPDFLNTGVGINATVSYDAGTRVITSSFSASQLYAGGGTPNTFSVSETLGAGVTFNVDSFGMMLWDDTPIIDQGFDAPVSASISFQGFSVNAAAAVPEPGTLMVLGVGGVMLLRRRRD